MKVIVTMINYVEELLPCTEVKFYTPKSADDNLFYTKNNDEVLNEQNRSKFYAIVAKLLYLSKRGKPDILLAVPYLTMRVTCAKAGDMEK